MHIVSSKSLSVAAANAPKIRDWLMMPKFFAKTNFVEFGNANSGGVWFGMFGENIHSYFGEKHVVADTSSGGDASLLLYFGNNAGYKIRRR